MAVSLASIPSPSSVFAAYASLSASIMLIQTMLHQLIPRQLQQYVVQIIRHYFKPKPNKTTILIEERDGLSSNEVYNAAETYLCTKMRPNIECFKICKSAKDTNFNIKIARCEVIADSFHGANLEWRYVYEEKKRNTKQNMVIHEQLDENVMDSEKRCFELSFDKVHKDLILDSYVPFILGKAKALKAQEKVVKLHTLACLHRFVWDSVCLKHPSTFDTLAMDPKMKKGIVDDLDRFLRRKEFYKKVGRAWKRGYLLYGPPGTGKSSLIAAMANYLKFDIYDLELTNVRRDSDLRKLLLRTGNQSILVIEDIDCSVELPERKLSKKADNPFSGDGNGTSYPRERQFTLSGLLNFIDGLWSSCGDERIIVFTTNHKEKLDPALLRPGRMDMHIHMSYLTMDGFKTLASTYLNMKGDQHPLFGEIEELLGVVKITPAEAAEELMHSDDLDISLQGIVDLLKFKKNVETSALMDEGVNEAESEDEVQQEIEAQN